IMKSNTGNGRPTIRSLASLILVLSGIVVIVTSIVLLTGPPTHVAQFSDWKLVGLTKCQWNAVHVMTGLLFLVVSIFHVFLNWKPILSYVKCSGWRYSRLVAPVFVSFLITMYVGIGTLTGLPPMQQIIDWLRGTKIEYVRMYGVPPYGPAEKVSIKNLSGYMGWDLGQCIENMKKNGLKVGSTNQSVREIAENNGIPVGMVIESMRK
ncbi:MAG: DUF4405 domain-containing protein, partial [Bacteroidales bacterium]|nr:DUF4405 domain-containing protein [Bacteroidales bacterium]